MISRLVILLRSVIGNGSIPTTLDAPNAVAIILLWRRYFKEKELQALENGENNGADEATQSIFESPENQELRRTERLNYYMRIKGQSASNPTSLATVAHQQLQQRVARDEARVISPNLQVPVDHDRAMYLAQ